MAPPNPFLDTYSAPLTPRRGWTLLIVAPLAVLRLVVVLCLFSLCSVFYLLLHEAKGDPVRKRFRKYPLVVAISQQGATVVMWLLGFSVKISGWENAERCFSKPGCPIIVMNHVSYMDVVVAIAVFGPYFPVARDDMQNWPLIGRVLRLWGFLGVPREQPAGGKGIGLAGALVERTRKADGPWMEYPPVLIYPEGTCSTGKVLLRFKSGAFVPGKPVLPVTLKYVVASGLCCGWVMPPPVSAPLWRRLPRDLVQFIRIVATTGKRIEVSIAPVYVPTEEEEKAPAKYAANVRSAMGKMLGVPEECDFDAADAREFYRRIDGSTTTKVKI